MEPADRDADLRAALEIARRDIRAALAEAGPDAQGQAFGVSAGALALFAVTAAEPEPETLAHFLGIIAQGPDTVPEALQALDPSANSPERFEELLRRALLWRCQPYLAGLDHPEMVGQVQVIFLKQMSAEIVGEWLFSTDDDLKFQFDGLVIGMAVPVLLIMSREQLAKIPLDVILNRVSLMLQSAGRFADETRLLSDRIGLDVDPRAPREVFAPHFRERLRCLPAESHARFSAFLALSYSNNNDPVRSRAVTEAFAAIEPADYDDRDRLAAKLRAALAGARPDTRAQFVVILAGAMSLQKQARRSIDVLEALPGLGAGDFSPEGLAARLGPWLAPMMADTRARFIEVLVMHRIGAGDCSQAADLLAYYLGLSSADLADHNRLDSRLAGAVHERLGRWLRTEPKGVPLEELVHRFSAAGILVQVAIAFSDRCPPESLLAMVEAEMGFDQESYQSPARLAEKLGENLGLVHNPAAAPLVLGQLANLLFAVGRRREASIVLRALAAVGPDLNHLVRPLVPPDSPLVDRFPDVRRRLDESDYAAGLAARLASLPPSVGLMALATAGRVLAGEGRAAEALALLAGRLEVSPDDADNERLASALAAALTTATAGELAWLLGALAQVADEAGRRPFAERLLGVFLWRAIDLGTLAGHADGDVVTLCPVLSLWLGDGRREDATLQRLRAILRFLRGGIDLHGTRLSDRRRFLTDVAVLRRSVVHAGWALIERAPTEAERKRLQIEVLEWDAELGQRLLFERYRLTPVAEGPPPAGEPCLARNSWCLQVPPPSKAGFFPDPDDLSAAAGLGCFGAVHEGAPSGRAAAGGRAEAAPWDLLRRGVTADDLAGALGDGAVLVRATFDPTGRLRWSAFYSDGSALSVLEGGASGEGLDAREQLERAIAWHDTAVAGVWADTRARGGCFASLCREVADRVTDVLAEMREDPESAAPLVRKLRDDLTADEARRALGWWLEICLRADGSVARDRVELLLGRLRTLTSGTTEERLDAATSAFLDWVCPQFDLSPLAGHLGANTDLVVEVDDVLHAVPVAFLRVKGRPLWEWVRSVRASLSPLLALARPAAPPGGASHPGRVVTVSWFEADDRARFGAAWLHHGQWQAAKRCGLDWVAAGDEPAGCAAAVREALAGPGPIRLLTVCGHGELHALGVKLQDPSLWMGAGCDFGKVDMLILLSCSVGRVRQNAAEPDVDGFSAELVARRARAALTCRWPVHAAQASGFANLVAEEHLSVGAGPVSAALALNRARRRAADEKLPVGPNTVAAFELYGPV